MKRIALYILGFTTIVILLSSTTKCSQAKEDKRKQFSFASTLDSLQGTWLSVNENDEVDSTNNLKISNRLWISQYDDGGIVTTDTCLFYFADTIVTGDTIAFSQLDTAAVSGNFIVHVKPLPNGQGFAGLGCWEVLGVAVINSETYFSMWPAPYGTMRQTQSFKKQ